MDLLKKHKRYFINSILILVLVMLILIMSFYSTTAIIKSQSRDIGKYSLNNISSNSQNILNSAETLLKMSEFSIKGMIASNADDDYIQGYINELEKYTNGSINYQTSGVYCYIKGKFFHPGGITDISDIESQSWYSNAVRANGNFVFNISDDKTIITISKYIINCGVTAIDINTDVIVNFMNDFVLERSMWSINDKNGDVIICSDEKADFSQYIDGYKDTEGTIELTDNKKQEYIMFYEKFNNSWYVNMIISKETLYHESYIILQRQMIFSIFFCFIIIVLYTNSYISNIKSENASKIKSRFLANISHEIRTPMSGILGLTQLAKEELDSPEQVSYYISKIEASAQFLKMLIDDVLDESKIEIGKMTINQEPFDLDELIKAMEDVFRPLIEEKGLKFIVNRNYENNCFLGDKMRLKQIIANLLNNALKFTEKGQIEWTVSYTTFYDNCDYADLHFSIKDTGVGIKEENILKIFNAFEQAESHTSQQYGGTGLGLAICSNLVKLMNGELNVTSEVGKGSDFFFNIKLKIPEQNTNILKEQDSPVKKYDFTDKKVLLAEDDELNAEIAVALLTKAGLKVDVANNGKEAVYMFETSGIRYYDIILMDIRMPEIDGIEATRQIRALSRSDAKDVIIIAMTANAFDEDQQRAIDAGMNEYLVKPVNVKILYKTINEMLGFETEE